VKPRLIATDLDGTLLLPDSTVSPRVEAALRAAQDAGITVVVLTARNWRSLGVLPPELFPHGLAACSNGAIVYDLSTGRVARWRQFDLDVLRAFLARVTAVCDAAIAWETPTGAFRTERYQAMCDDTYMNAAYLASIQRAEEIADEHVVTKVLVRHETMKADELLGALAPVAESVSLTVSGGVFVEVMAPGVTKAAALATLCEELGITAAEVVAVGDHTNDIPMLQWAGRGVAMGNAHPAVLAEIAEHTAPNTEDGLALVIEDVLSKW
jgi:Cof subfamily protein (haloacid dehalogenase superfamily)